MKYNYTEILKQLFREHIPADGYLVFLFGSRAVKNNHERSDIDIGVWGMEPLPTLIKADLEIAIEESKIPYFVDIVDFSLVDEQFRKEALKNIEVWNYPKNLNVRLKV